MANMTLREQYRVAYRIICAYRHAARNINAPHIRKRTVRDVYKEAIRDVATPLTPPPLHEVSPYLRHEGPTRLADVDAQHLARLAGCGQAAIDAAMRSARMRRTQFEGGVWNAATRDARHREVITRHRGTWWDQIVRMADAQEARKTQEAAV